MRLRGDGKVFVLFCMLGFLIGILYTNIAAKDYVAGVGIFSDYFLDQYVQTEIVTQEYLWYLLKVRITPAVALLVLGCLRIRKGAVLGFLLWTGFLSGMFFTLAVMKMGGMGILFALTAAAPQFIFYITGFFILLWNLYNYPRTKWDASKTLVVLLLISVGILLECYVNPVLVKMFVNGI